MKKTILLIAVLGMFINAQTQTNEIEADADINSVTIYNSSVEIHYSKEISIPKGNSTVVFTGLTPYIVENTLNISTSNKDVQIITVTERINYMKERKENNTKIKSIEDSIKSIVKEQGLIRCSEEALNMEKGLLFRDESIGGVARGVSVSEIEKASAFYNKRYLEIVLELFRIGNQQEKLSMRLEKYNKQLIELSSKSSKACSEVVVALNSSSSKSIEISFKFLSPKGGWAPAYDCKYQGNNAPINFIFRANVFNSTGIAWENVNIKLSTASPTLGFEKPSFANLENQSQKTDEKSIEFTQMSVANSIAEYDIKNTYTIPSDSKPYLIEVETYEMKSEFNYLLIPKLEPYGFLMAKIPDWNKYNLIPGKTNIYNKGSYMGKTFLNTYAENDTLNIYLGKDNSIVSIRKEVTSTNLQKIIGNYYVDKSSVSISIKNNSSESFKIQVLDQVPVFSDYDKTKFNLHNIDQAEYDKIEGLLTWDYSINKDENIVIDYKYEIKVPKAERSSYSYSALRKYRTISCPMF